MPEETEYNPELEALINETLAEEEAPKKPELTQKEQDLVKNVIKKMKDKEKIQVAVGQSGAGMSSSALEVAKKIMADAGLPGPVQHPSFEEGGVPAGMIPKRAAAVEVIKYTMRLNRLAMVGIGALLIAVGAAPIEYFISLVAGGAGLGYCMWEFVQSRNNITFLKQRYGV